jgi:endonuclease/exonuclease/phosphatase family metal-dependent hydrolase
MEIRRQQLAALEPLLEDALEYQGRIVLLGDFNATSDEDRSAIAGLANRSHMLWLSEGLECTSYWDRDDGCQGSALDHILVTGIPLGIKARGPCEREGCEPDDRCPVFHHEISDHCPVTIDIL